jgi:hypothetical protein
MATPIVRDHAEAILSEEKHLAVRNRAAIRGKTLRLGLVYQSDVMHMSVEELRGCGLN